MEEENKNTNNKNTRNIIVVVIAVIVILAITAGGFLFLRNSQIVQPEAQTSTVQEQPSVSEGESNTDVKTFDMTAKQWEFIPSTITVNQGDRVKLNITSIDVTHGFAISEFGVNGTLKPNETTTVEFRADKKGEFRFFCSVFCGAGHATMDGTLIVE